MSLQSILFSTTLALRVYSRFEQADLYFGTVDDEATCEHFRREGWIMGAAEAVLTRFATRNMNSELCPSPQPALHDTL